MSLKEGAETVVNQCMDIESGEEVLVLNDGNDQDLINSLLEVLDNVGADYRLMEYEEPENHGEEPPQEVAESMKEADAVIAPTLKSLSHTDARHKANEAGSRVATMPTVTKKVWNQSLNADYEEVRDLSRRFYNALENVSEVRIETPSGTDLTLKVDRKYFEKDTGFIREEGDFGNLPAGEADGGVIDANGVLVIDHFPFAPEGTEIEIEDNRAVAVRHEDEEESELTETFEEFRCAKQVAELGIGTNPKATLIGNVLQDEKVKGTVHVAFGDNSSYFSENHEKRNVCDIHWDTICEDPTVKFDGEKVIDKGEILINPE
ncbi:MAG: leucyl aminopeptidase [Nanohaloarchaea archaeon SW_7_43_1]|nr:MAG: leucyl aminopeptidase [Nanohaloarchaea archaeon SW_7_43_1]